MVTAEDDADFGEIASRGYYTAEYAGQSPL